MSEPKHAGGQGSGGAGADRCPVCGEPKKAGSQRCPQCESLYSWTENCRCCGTPIPKDARVCHECGLHPASTGRWERYMRSGQGTLSLLIALFSVIGTLFALASQSTLFRESSTSATLAAFPPEGSDASPRDLWIDLTVYNSGNSPSLVSGARLVTEVADGDKREAWLRIERTRIEPDDPKEIRLLLEGGWDVQTLFGIDGRQSAAYVGYLAKPHRLELGIQEFGQERRWKKVEGVPGAKLRGWLQDVTTESTIPQGSATKEGV